MNAVMEKAFDSGVLDKDVHMRLVADIERISNMAGIPKELIWTSSKKFLSDSELEWIMKYEFHKKNLKAGLVITGGAGHAIEAKFMSMTGLLVRNFVDARMMIMQNVLDKLEKQKMSEPSVLLIPNFHIEKHAGGQLPAWKISNILGMLMHRHAAARMSILYVSDMDSLLADYGEVVYNHLVENYAILSNK